MSQNSYQQTTTQSQQKLIHKLTIFAAIATPIMTLPQVYQIWIQGNTSASVVTWTSYILIAFIWLYYGIEGKDKPMIIMQILCIIVYSSIVVGLIVK